MPAADGIGPTMICWMVFFLSIFAFLLLRIDDIEDNSKLRRGIPGNVGWNIQAYSQAK